MNRTPMNMLLLSGLALGVAVGSARGQTEARVSMSQVLAKPHAFGVGAVEGLRGEIIIDDGRSWTAEVVAQSGRPVAHVREGVQSRGATLMVVAGRLFVPVRFTRRNL